MCGDWFGFFSGRRKAEGKQTTGQLFSQESLCSVVGWKGACAVPNCSSLCLLWDHNQKSNTLFYIFNLFGHSCRSDGVVTRRTVIYIQEILCCRLMSGSLNLQSSFALLLSLSESGTILLAPRKSQIFTLPLLQVTVLPILIGARALPGGFASQISCQARIETLLRSSALRRDETGRSIPKI